MSTVQDIPDDIENNAGPLLFGYVFSWGLYGILCVQTYLYFIAFPRDKRYTKILVYGVFIIETLQAAFVAHDAFLAFARGFGKVNALEGMYHAWLTMPVISGIVAAIVQTFYAYRIWVISRSVLAGLVIVLLAIIQCVGAIMAGVAGLKAGSLAKLTSGLELAGHAIWTATSSANDVIISLIMTYYLGRVKTNLTSTQTMLTRLILLTMGTGLLTATVAIINLVLFYADHRGNFYLTPATILGKLYSNSMMVVLNSRLAIIGGRYNPEALEIITFSDLIFPNEENAVSTKRPSISGSPSDALIEGVYITSLDNYRAVQAESREKQDMPQKIEIELKKTTVVDIR